MTVNIQINVAVFGQSLLDEIKFAFKFVRVTFYEFSFSRLLYRRFFEKETSQGLCVSEKLLFFINTIVLTNKKKQFYLTEDNMQMFK